MRMKSLRPLPERCVAPIVSISYFFIRAYIGSGLLPSAKDDWHSRESME